MKNQRNNEKVFISHESNDKSVAKIIQDFLEENMDVFCSSYNIKGGEKWRERIDYELGNCKYFLILCSENSIKSTFVWYELGFAKARHPEVKIIPIIIDLKIEELPHTIQEFQCLKYEGDLWKKELDIAMNTGQCKKVYDWDGFNLSLEELQKLVDRNVINIDRSRLDRYNSIFDMLVKEGQVSFSTNDDGYISLTRYSLPHNLVLQLLGSGYCIKSCIYYMRFILSSEFEKLLRDPKCKFAPNYKR